MAVSANASAGLNDSGCFRLHCAVPQNAISKMVFVAVAALELTAQKQQACSTLITAPEIVRAGGATVEMSFGRWPLFRMIVRTCVPFYRPRRWYEVVRGLYDMAIGYKVTCVALRKQPEAADSNRGPVRAGCRLQDAPHEPA
jgi:hypothetical protein